MTKSLRRIAAGGALTLALAAGGTAYASYGSGSDHVHTIKLTEASATVQPAVLDLGKPGATPGDLVIVKDGVNFRDGSHAGDFVQTCTLITPGTNPFDSTYDCAGTLSLAAGQITMHGSFDPTQAQQFAAVTGGTGFYRGARGDIDIRSEADQLTVRLLKD
jgi:allene oxide cyclase-like protein